MKYLRGFYQDSNLLYSKLIVRTYDYIDIVATTSQLVWVSNPVPSPFIAHIWVELCSYIIDLEDACQLGDKRAPRRFIPALDFRFWGVAGPRINCNSSTPYSVVWIQWFHMATMPLWTQMTRRSRSWLPMQLARNWCSDNKMGS